MSTTPRERIGTRPGDLWSAGVGLFVLVTILFALGGSAVYVSNRRHQSDTDRLEVLPDTVNGVVCYRTTRTNNLFCVDVAAQ